MKLASMQVQLVSSLRLKSKIWDFFLFFKNQICDFLPQKTKDKKKKASMTWGWLFGFSE